jgi:hypothetical protein
LRAVFVCFAPVFALSGVFFLNPDDRPEDEYSILPANFLDKWDYVRVLVIALTVIVTVNGIYVFPV